MLTFRDFPACTACSEMARSVQYFPESGDYLTFVEEFLLRNEPCVFTETHTRDWRARRQWQTAGKPNLETLSRDFGMRPSALSATAAVQSRGGVSVPVADCSREQFSSHCKSEMKMAEHLTYWRGLMEEEERAGKILKGGGEGEGRGGGGEGKETALLYLKDWHFLKQHPHYDAYTVLDYFSSDWLNEVWDCRRDAQDDYRFVYMGPRGTWTPFHADVFRSYSWSANVCGRKEWLLFPPGEEEKLRDSHGRLPFDLRETANCAGAIRVIQEAGEIIFVPSGWYHQVHNLADTISINHNWVNAFNIECMWKHLKSELLQVKQEIADCRDMEGWDHHCQVMLRACVGMDYRELLQMLCLLAQPRLEELAALSSVGAAHFHNLKELVTRAMSCEELDFFGTRQPHMEGPKQASMGRLPSAAAVDRLYEVLRRCPRVMADHGPPPALALLGSLPEKFRTRLAVEREEATDTLTQTVCNFLIHELQQISRVAAELAVDRDMQAELPDCLL